MSINYEDLSGKVLWRNVDCFGNVQEWEHPFQSAGAVNGAMQRALSKMKKEKDGPCETTTITSCGSGPAAMPGGGNTQDFNVEFNEDGSVTTTYTVSGAQSAGAAQRNAGHIFKNPASPNNQSLINKGPNHNPPGPRLKL